MVLFLLVIFAAISLFLLWRERLLKEKSYFIAAVLLTAAALLIRFFCLDHKTGDYNIFLSQWVDFFRQNGGFLALSQPVGNYNLPYLYFLAAFSYLDFSDLYLIKLLSVVFDIMLAYYSMKLCSRFTESSVKRLLCFFLILFLPTVVLNGAYWGQCDSIYGAFAVMSLYFSLSDRPVRAVISVALAFAFKLQAIFILPIFLILLYVRKIKIRHLFVFPLTYVMTVLPAVIAGRPFLDAILFYFNMTESAGSGLNYNSPSLYSFITPLSESVQPYLATLGIAAALILVGVVFLILYLKRKYINNQVFLVVSLIFVVGIPLLLPHMHDRYFFLADVLSIVYAVCNQQRFTLPVLVSFASLLGYHAYLKFRYLLPMYCGAGVLLVVLFVLFIDLILMLRED